jgi:hypothetical protein
MVAAFMDAFVQVSTLDLHQHGSVSTNLWYWPEQALLVNLFFSAVLLGSIYGLGKHLFNTQ